MTVCEGFNHIVAIIPYQELLGNYDLVSAAYV